MSLGEFLDYEGLRTYDSFIKKYVDEKEVQIKEFTDIDVENEITF